MRIKGLLKYDERQNEQCQYIFKSGNIQVGVLELYFSDKGCSIILFDCEDNMKTENFILNFAIKVAKINRADYITVTSGDNKKLFIRKGFNEKKIRFSLKGFDCRSDNIIEFNLNRKKVAPVVEYIKYI